MHTELIVRCLLNKCMCSQVNERTTLTPTAVTDTARNHWIIFFNPIALSPWFVFSHLFFFFFYSNLFSFFPKPVTDVSTWVLLEFYPEKDGALTDLCMSGVYRTVHGAG